MFWNSLRRDLDRIQMISLAALALGGLCGSAVAQGTSTQGSAAKVLITGAVNNNDRVVVGKGLRPMVAKASDLGAAPTTLTASHMAMVLTRSAEQQAALKQYLRDVQNPKSASYHQWLTPAQFGERFGASTADIQTITTWLTVQGFAVKPMAAARNVIFFSGSVGQVQSAFSTKVHSLMVNGERHIANVTDVQLPRALAVVVTGVTGIDDFRTRSQAKTTSTAQWNPETHKFEPALTLFDSHHDAYLYTDPADAAVMYDTPNSALNPKYTGTTYDGTGVTVGIVGDSNFTMQPVSNYRQAFLGETSGNVNLPTVIIDGDDPGVNGDSVESYLDVEVLGGIAPKAKINYYTSAGTDLSDPLFDSIERAINDNQVSILSISYGGCEAMLGTDTNTFINEIYQQAAAQGITVVTSTGDNGSAGCDNQNTENAAVNGLAVSGLSSTPYNVAVGGTDFPALLNNFTEYVDNTTSGTAPYYLTAKSYIPEEPWNDSTSVNGLLANNVPEQTSSGTNIIGGTGGKSSVYAKPDFQTALTPADSARDVPDVSFLAGNGFYAAAWALCETSAQYGDLCATTNGQLTSSTVIVGAGGTSAATPAFAGILALIEQAQGSRLGLVNDTLYRIAGSKYSAAFHDVTTGNNSVVCSGGSPDCGNNGFLTGYDATTGYDLASGLGSVDASALLANWSSGAGTTTTTALTIDNSTAAVNVVHGTSLNFAIAITPGTATGTASIVNNATQASGDQTLNGSSMAMVNIASGAGALAYNGLPGGTYQVFANYTGDATNEGSQSSPISVTISPEDASTQLTVAAYNASGQTLSGVTAVPYGSYLFGHASVYGTVEGFTNSFGAGVGTYTFYDNGTQIGTAVNTTENYGSFPSVTGTAYPYAVGTHSLTASWSGDASYKANTSSPAVFTIVKASTSIAVSPAVTQLSSLISDLVTIDVNTTGTGLGPTGTVTLTANGKTIATSGSLTGAQSAATGAALGMTSVSIAGSSLAAGANTITVTYAGDANYTGSTATFVLNVTEATYSITAGAVSITPAATTGNTSTATITPSGSFAGVVNLSCAVTSAPANAVSPVTCSVPAQVNITGTSPVTATLTIGSTDTTSGGAYVVTISGVDAATGSVKASATAAVTVTAPASFSVTNNAAISITAGATTGNTSTISVTPVNGFLGTVAMTCTVTSSPSGAVHPVTCGLSSSSVAVTGAAAVTSTLTINSTAATTSSASLMTPNRERSLFLRGAGGTALAFTMMWLLPVRRRRFARLLLMLLMLGGLGAAMGCGGGGSGSTGSGGTTTVPGTTAGTYVVTVTGTSGSLTQASTVNVTVN